MAPFGSEGVLPFSARKLYSNVRALICNALADHLLIGLGLNAGIECFKSSSLDPNRSSSLRGSYVQFSSPPTIMLDRGGIPDRANSNNEIVTEFLAPGVPLAYTLNSSTLLPFKGPLKDRCKISSELEL